ncbi:hypothetical protein BDQ12DRAFT_685061 [Crucibulum laeve]|uniref:DUF1857-domain-containing protein n=1 Tax=Crucibulum laeve TaxID=68775 RepID=A0A5C3LWZ4_9AGAR|nr:hypothetical protein BDQ12DRAFT_685061 [Crucibulum laeve]
MSASINFAASRLVNPPGASPRLTEAQVWKGLEYKARNPQDFVAAISDCNILSDAGNKILRSISLNSNRDATMKEEVQLYNGTIAYFDAVPSGPRITNIISYDASNELVLTFSFAGGIPGFSPVEGSEPGPRQLNQSVGAGVEVTIERIRKLVQEGSLQS